MSASVGLSVTAALLAMGAGFAKLASPRTAVEAMQRARLASSDALVRAASLGEIALGALVLVWGTWLACALLALAYASFGVFSIVAIRTGRAAPCGCFGTSGSVIGWRHVWTDVVLAAGLSVSAATGAPSALRLAQGSHVLGAATAVVAAVGALLAAAFLSGPVATARAGLGDA
jgi:hypothetical protein